MRVAISRGYFGWQVQDRSFGAIFNGTEEECQQWCAEQGHTVVSKVELSNDYAASHSYAGDLVADKRVRVHSARSERDNAPVEFTVDATPDVVKPATLRDLSVEEETDEEDEDAVLPAIVLLNEQHSLLPAQTDLLNGLGRPWVIRKVPATGWTAEEIRAQAEELRECSLVVFASPVPLLIKLVAASGNAYSCLPQWQEGCQRGSRWQGRREGYPHCCSRWVGITVIQPAPYGEAQQRRLR